MQFKPQSFTPPAWFTFRSRLQEDTVASVEEDQDSVDRMQEAELSAAKEAMLPRMAEVVRDLESKPVSAITGGTRAWTPEAYERVRRNRRKSPKYWFKVMKKGISYLFPSLTYG